MLVSYKRSREFMRLQCALCGGRDVMCVFVEIAVDEVHGVILGGVVSIALFSGESRGDHLASSIELCGNDMRAFFEAQADEGFHDRDHAMRAVFQSLPSLERKTALLDLQVILTH